MGCDIHLYLEYKSKTDTDRWTSFAGRINPGRNYWLFSIIAGVRQGYINGSVKPGVPKGLPDDIGYHSFDDNFLIIRDNPSDSWERSCTTEQAERWGSPIIESNGRKWAYNPDWHSHTWLTVDEYRNALMTYNSIADEYPAVEYEALLAAAQRIEEMGFDVRFVIWFDN